MVFVHARNETVKTALVLADMCRNRNESQYFLPDQNKEYARIEKQVNNEKILLLYIY